MPTEVIAATLSRNTKIQVGLVMTVLAAVTSGSIWGTRVLSGLQETAAQHGKLIEALQKESWTIAAQSEHALRTAMENPGLRVPDPRDPSHIFEVRRTGPSAANP